MSFTKRINQRIRLSSTIVVSYSLLVVALSMILPYENSQLWSSHSAWLLGIPICYTVHLAFELFAKWALRLPIWRDIPDRSAVLLLAAIFTLGVMSLMYFGDAHFTLEVTHSYSVKA